MGRREIAALLSERWFDRKHSLVFHWSQHSQLDGEVRPEEPYSYGISAPCTVGGANLTFFPFGTVLSRAVEQAA